MLFSSLIGIPDSCEIGILHTSPTYLVVPQEDKSTNSTSCAAITVKKAQSSIQFGLANINEIFFVGAGGRGVSAQLCYTVFSTLYKTGFRDELVL